MKESLYADRLGQPITHAQWAQLIPDDAYRIVAETLMGPYIISTVWTGVPSVGLFETLVDLEDEEVRLFSDTYVDAVQAHKDAVQGCNFTPTNESMEYEQQRTKRQT